MKLEKFLPIGSIVILKEAKKKLMITGFCAINDETKAQYDYCGCLYPEGQLAVKETFLFNHDQIAKIFYLGYDDDEEKEFKKQLKKIIEEVEK